MRTAQSRFLVAVAATVTLLAAGAAEAQMMPGGGRNIAPPRHRDAGQPTVAPPPALPGANNGFQPADRTGGDLAPTEALFDAINRGDIGSARDAINRGADLAGHNILGMSPLELSVDLSRNNITFLLLSLRGSTTAPAQPAATAATSGGTHAGTKQPNAKVAATAAKPAPKKLAAAARPAPRPATSVPPATPQQFAGSAGSGAPVPQAGFLGFGGTVQ